MSWLTKKRVIFFNRLLLIALLFTLPFTFPFVSPETWEIVIVDCFVIVACLLVSLGGRFILSTWLFLIYQNLSLLYVSYVTDFYAAEHVFYILLIAVSPLILDFSEKKNLIFSSVLTVGCYGLVQFHYWGVGSTLIADTMVPLDYRINLILAFIGSFVITYNFFKITRKQHRYLLKINEVLRSKEKALNDTLDRLQKELDIKSHLLSLMSHEIRTPLNATLNLSRKLKSEHGFTRDQIESLEIINFSSNNMLSMVNDILDWSRIEANGLELEQEPFELNKLLNSVANLGTSLINADNKDVKLLLDLDTKLPKYIYGDESKLSQVLLNLISNAVKFTSHGEVVITVKLVLQEHDTIAKNIYFEIRDTGIGIAQNSLKQIFETFVQADNRIAKKYGGTGLGLYIAKKIVEAMGSQLEVKSCQGLGSTFYFTYDVRVSETNDSDTNTMDSLKGKKVLIVDDNKVNIMIASQCVEQWGMVHQAAANGLEALKMVESNTYDLILMDISMPGMDGFETTKIMRDIKHMTIPIVAIGGQLQTKDSEKALEIGLDGLLPKPIDPGKLKSLVDFLLVDYVKVSGDTSSA